MGEIKLSGEFEVIIQRHIESGHYDNAQDVIAAGLSLLDVFEGTEEFSAAINQSLDDGSEDISIERAFEHIEAIYLQDMKARG